MGFSTSKTWVPLKRLNAQSERLEGVSQTRSLLQQFLSWPSAKLKDFVNGTSPKLQCNSQAMFIFCAVIFDCQGQKASGLKWDMPSYQRSLRLATAALSTWEIVHYTFCSHFCSFSDGLGTASLSGLWKESFTMKTANIKRCFQWCSRLFDWGQQNPAFFMLKKNYQKMASVVCTPETL